MFLAMISLLAENHAFLDGNLEIYTLELIKVYKHYWEGCQTLFGRLPKFNKKVAKLYGQMDILIYNTFDQLPILFSFESLILFILFAIKQ